jgi:hypothetical protein
MKWQLGSGWCSEGCSEAGWAAEADVRVVGYRNQERPKQQEEEHLQLTEAEAEVEEVDRTFVEIERDVTKEIW